MLTRPGALLKIEETALLLGAAIYNFGHLVVWPVIAFAVGYGTGRSVWMAVGIIWFAHIAMDRMLGFGLKYPGAFKDTHLQHVG